MLGELLASLLYGAFETLASGGGANPKYLKISEGMISFSNELWKYVAFIAIGMTLIYFIWEMNNKILFEGRDANMKTIIIPFAKCALAFGILGSSPQLIGNIVGFYNSTIDAVDGWNVSVAGNITSPFSDGESGGGTGKMATKEELDEKKKENWEKITAATNGMGLIQAIGFLPIALIMWLLQMILKIIWCYKGIGLQLEVLWRLGLSPIALSDCYNGMNSNAIRWIKGLIATGLYAASFILIVKMGNALVSANAYDVILNWATGENTTDVTDAFGAIKNAAVFYLQSFESMIQFIIIPFAELGVLSAVKQATKEALG